MKSTSPCPVCDAASPLLDVVDFNKSCQEMNGKFLALSGDPIYYARCNHCGFCFAPEFAAWTPEEFRARIYNDEYVLFDPEYTDIRPRTNAARLISMFGDRGHSIRHLDFGGGDGLLSSVLNNSNWRSVSYDPFVDGNAGIPQLGKFDLISSFEVFEHVPDPRSLMADLCSLLAPDGVVLFSTLLSDGYIHPDRRMSWWYASPRNGHISLYSRNSLVVLAQGNGFNFGSFSDDLHVFFTGVPPWAEHVLRVG